VAIVLSRIASTIKPRSFALTVRSRSSHLVTLSPRRAIAALGATSFDVSLEGDGIERGADGLPVAIRLFRAGENQTTKGVFLFDATAAEVVLSAASDHGADVMIDLEHLSIDPDAPNYDPDSRGWLKLEVRNGELWATNITWTPDGARRLTEKTQRYISPAFQRDAENRVTEIVNIALVAMPATYGTPALVAANRRQKPMTLAQRLALIALLTSRQSVARSTMVKLAEGEGDAPSGKFAAIQAAAAKASEALAALESPKGVDEGMAAIDAAKAAVAEFESAVAAMAGPAPAPAPEVTSEDPSADKTEQMARERAELIQLRREKEARVESEKVEKLAAEKVERRDLVATLVKLGRETPGTAWADESATTPKGYLATMPIAELRQRVKDFGGVPSGVQLSSAPRPPTGGVVTSPGGAEVSEFEIARVKLKAERAKEVHGTAARSVDEAVSRYIGHKNQQVCGAKSHADVKRLGHRVEEGHVLLGRNGRDIVTLATSPVTPIQEFGASSQRALEEFRLEYNMALATEPKAWAEMIGNVLPGGGLKETFPINFSANKYREKTAQGPANTRSKNVDISVSKREFNSGEQIELRRLTGGDFAYIQSWGQLAARMARARIMLRNALVTTLLEAGTSSYWGYDAVNYTTGIDGQPFWSASHMVNPFDATATLRGSATWSNYQSSATPMGAANLTAEKATSIQVAGPDGNELSVDYDGVLVPSVLKETTKNLLTIQDFILDAKSTLNSVSNVMGPVKNPHYMSGMDIAVGPELAGTAASTANYYLLSKAAIARGLVPWVIAEDGAEDLRTFDENSDFFKESGEIKVVSHIYINAALLYPHAIRYVKGS